jgi:hypothetical protein
MHGKTTIKISLISGNNNRYCTCRPTYICDYLAQFFLAWEMFQTKVVQEIKTHILCRITLFSWKSRHLWDNVEKYFRAGRATDDNMAHAHCMLGNKRYKHTLTICSTYCFPLQQWLKESASMLRCNVHCLSSFILTNFGRHQAVPWLRRCHGSGGWSPSNHGGLGSLSGQSLVGKVALGQVFSPSTWLF